MTLGPFVSTITRLRINQPFKLCFLKSVSRRAFSCAVQPTTAYNLFEISPRRDLLPYNCMLFDYSHNERNQEALDLFLGIWRSGLLVDGSTMSCVLKVCGCIFDQVAGRQLHSQCIKSGFVEDVSVATSLVDMYMKTEASGDARKVFDEMCERNVVSWTFHALSIKSRLHNALSITPNEFTFSSVIHACAAPTAAFEQGKQFHALSIKSRLHNALCVSSALIMMYAKRGNIKSANEVFKRQDGRDLVSWNSMISGFAQHGQGKKALEVFMDMQRQQLKVDGITFIGVISGCTHTGLVDEGERYFNMMVQDHKICPTMEHYSCMVDLYSRAGMLEKAMDIINGMPFPPSATVWRTVLASCRVHRNLELGKLAAQQLISLQPQDSAAYVLLSNIYAAAGNWQERAKVRKLMDERKVKKEAGYSWIEVKNKTHSFLAGDLSHPLSEKIYSKLEGLNIRLRDMGYQADTNYVLHDVDEEHKAAILSQHSERLAIAFGLIATSPGTPLQIVKNLRVCGDCHNVIKLLSTIEGREIVVRDSNRFHHFKGGLCSCGDYW